MLCDDTTKNGGNKFSPSENKKEDLQNKFNKLKERRAKLTMESKQTVNTSKCTFLCDDEKLLNRRKEVASNELTELNAYMPYSFTVSTQLTEAKKNKLEKEVDDALKKRDFLLCEKLSEQIEKERFTEQVKGALAAKKYMKDTKRKLVKKTRKNKLKWTFDKKERWETKGNM